MVLICLDNFRCLWRLKRKQSQNQKWNIYVVPVAGLIWSGWCKLLNNFSLDTFKAFAYSKHLLGRRAYSRTPWATNPPNHDQPTGIDVVTWSQDHVANALALGFSFSSCSGWEKVSRAEAGTTLSEVHYIKKKTVTSHLCKTNFLNLKGLRYRWCQLYHSGSPPIIAASC